VLILEVSESTKIDLRAKFGYRRYARNAKVLKELFLSCGQAIAGLGHSGSAPPDGLRCGRSDRSSVLLNLEARHSYKNDYSRFSQWPKTAVSI
jgi:hypothetical protein